MTLFNDLISTLADGLQEGVGVSPKIDDLAPLAPNSWDDWLTKLLPNFFPADFSFYHKEFWEWAWAIEANKRARPLIAVWPRDTGKSTSTEALCVMTGARRTRKYVLYVCETQDQADDHVSTVSNMMVLPSIAKHYPSFSNRALNKFGSALSWRRARVRAANGFILEGLGLDKARRGAKLDEARPDLIIFDDVDGEADTLLTVGKKIKSLTRKIIPAGSAHSTVVGVQNLVHSESIFSRLVEGKVDFLMDRFVSGPHPAVIDMEVESKNGLWAITKGAPTWSHMSIERCEDKMNTSGLDSFKVEMQHETEEVEGLVFRGFLNSLDGNLEAYNDSLEAAVEGQLVFDHKKPFELGVDDGYVDHRAVIFIQKQANHILVFDEIYKSRQLEEATITAILHKCTKWHCWGSGKNIKDVWPDKAEDMKLIEISRYLKSKGVMLPDLAAVSHEAVQLRKRLQSADITARNWMQTKVSKGSTRIEAIKLTRRAIMDDKGYRMIKIVQGKCPNLIREITKSYRYPEGKRATNEKPLDGNDHACEALENWIWLRMRRQLQKGE